MTSGVVSRIEVTAYAHGATELLGVQIDAAINSGNSGGWVAEGWRVGGLTLVDVASKAPNQRCSTVCLNRNVVPVAPHAWLPPVYSRWGCRRVQSLPLGWALKGGPLVSSLPATSMPTACDHSSLQSLQCSPVFNELGEVVGIAFQSYAGSDAENIGYVIPTPGALCAKPASVPEVPAIPAQSNQPSQQLSASP